MNNSNFYSSGRRHTLDIRTTVYDDNNGNRSETDLNDEGGNESDPSLESVDLNHNASEAETFAEHQIETEIPNNISSNDLYVLDASQFSSHVISKNDEEEKERKSQNQDDLLLDDRNPDASLQEVFLNNSAESSQLCLKHKKTSLSTSLQNTERSFPVGTVPPLSSAMDGQSFDEPSRMNCHRSSVFDDLLFEIYDRWHYGYKDSLDSDTFTDMTESDVVLSRSEQGRTDGEKVRLNVVNLMGRDTCQLRQLLSELVHCSSQMSCRLVKQLKARERHMTTLREKYDIMTAILHASSLKRSCCCCCLFVAGLFLDVCLRGRARACEGRSNSRGRLFAAAESVAIDSVFLSRYWPATGYDSRASDDDDDEEREDSKIRFSIEPVPGEDAFIQWKDAMKAVARLPHGIPEEFRIKVWLSLADNYLNNLCIDWEKTKKLAFNEKSNPDDNKLGLQIVKDLHRTGCSGFSGRDNDEDRAVLKRVLLAYARWNKHVGYCQGFNILAALILEVVDRREDCALKVMIYLIDRVLPESYFANNLRSLSVDMAVFRNLLRTHLPELSRHLDSLQNVARDETVGANYEPPLTNVFTMQWFLTMFATCLSKTTVLRVWDCILLDGSEILLRTAIVIWEKLQHRIMEIKNADEFYTTMGILSQEMLEGKLLDTEDLIKRIFSIASFPLQQLNELREKFTYNITPFSNMMNANKMSMTAKSNLIQEEEELDDMVENIHCFSALFSGQNSAPSKSKEDVDFGSADVSKLSPGAYTAHPEMIHNFGVPAMSERVTLDVDMLKKQYRRLMKRQRQAHVILSAVHNKKISNDPLKSQNTVLKGFSNQNSTDMIPPTINHLFASRKLLLMTTNNKRNQTVMKMIQNNAKTDESLALDGSSSESQERPAKYSQSSSLEETSGQSDGTLGNTELVSLVTFPSSSSSSISVVHDDRSTKSDVTCEPSRPWTESTRPETPAASNGEPPASDPGCKKENTDENTQTNEDATKEVKELEEVLDGEAKENKDDDNDASNMSFKEFIDSLPDDTNPDFKSTRYNKLQCFMENFRPIGHNSKGQRSSFSGQSDGNEFSMAISRPLQAFNPFPKKNLTSRKSQLGVQLGLYISQECTKVRSEMTCSTRFSHPQRDIPISKTYRNACLHRQYLVSMTKQSEMTPELN